MADKTTPKTLDEDGAEGRTVQIEAQVVAQFVKDLSFENPNAERFLAEGPGEKPNIKLEINVLAKRL